MQAVPLEAAHSAEGHELFVAIISLPRFCVFLISYFAMPEHKVFIYIYVRVVLASIENHVTGCFEQRVCGLPLQEAVSLRLTSNKSSLVLSYLALPIRPTQSLASMANNATRVR
jgi:hypothetical protein